MSRREQLFARIAEFRTRFDKLSSARLRERLASGFLVKEAGVAAREGLDERAKAGTPTIFVGLLDEGVDVWRPVEARMLANGLFRIESVNQTPETEVWQFPTGAVVQCEPRTFADGQSGLVAVQPLSATRLTSA